ncbi:hypothetical protein ACA910_011848 [Epithemia clementina (nom. ined.)]
MTTPSPPPQRPPAMIGPAQITMGLVLMLSVSAVGYSHYAQVRDRKVMRAGVERDKERLRFVHFCEQVAQSAVQLKDGDDSVE